MVTERLQTSYEHASYPPLYPLPPPPSYSALPSPHPPLLLFPPSYSSSILSGPFLELDAEEVEEEVGTMWRTMHKLTRTFADQPNPKRMGEVVKSRLDKFKTNLPLLQVFCNPGIRDRHWQRVSEYMNCLLLLVFCTCLPLHACMIRAYKPYTCKYKVVSAPAFQIF